MPRVKQSIWTFHFKKNVLLACPFTVIQPKGANRRLKTDGEKIEKKTLQDREKYQPSFETTILNEV